MAKLLFSPASVWIQAGLLRSLARWFGPRNARALTHVDRVVIIKIDRIGDFVMVTPFLRELRRNRPAAWITLVVAEFVFDLARSCPHVDEVLAVARAKPGVAGIYSHWRQWIILAWSRLLAVRPTLAVLPRWDIDLYDGYALLALSGAPRRVSYSSRVSAAKDQLNRHANWLLTDSIAETPHLHDVERNLDLLSAIGGEVSCTDLEDLWVGDDNTLLLDRLIAARAKDILIALCPLSAEAIKDWPFLRFVEVVKRFSGHPGVTFVLLAGPEYAQLGDEPCVRELTNLISLAGKLSLRETALLLRQCSMVLSVDTGLAHITAAVRRPIVLLSGLPAGHDESSHYSPARYGPWKADCTYITPPTDTTGERLIDGITVDKVVEALTARLALVAT